MSTLNLTVDTKVLMKQIKGVNRAITIGTQKGMQEAMKVTLRDAKQRAPVKSGQLRRSITAKLTKVSAYRLKFELGVGVPNTKGKPLIYAKIQDVGSGYLPGGVVKPKTAKKLAIPFHKKLKTKAGVGGISPRSIIEDPGQIGFEGTFTSAKAILGWRRVGAKKKKRTETLFLRRDSVRIKGSKYLTIPYQKLSRTLLREKVAESIKAELQRAQDISDAVDKMYAINDPFK